MLTVRVWSKIIKKHQISDNNFIVPSPSVRHKSLLATVHWDNFNISRLGQLREAVKTTKF